MQIRRVVQTSRVVARGVTLVEVLIVLAIMSLIAGGAAILVFPQFAKAKVQTAVLDAGTIRKAAELHQNLDNVEGCPSVQDLVASKKLESGKTNDPWGRPYKVICADGEVHVVSLGKDGKEGTPDDIRDDLKRSDIERIANGS